MSLHYADGDILVLPAPVGGAVLDVPQIVGNLFLIPRATASAGVVISWEYKGIKELPQAAGQTFNALGQPVYWNASNGNCESATSATNYLIGTLQAIPASGTANLLVLLPGDPVFVGGVPGDIQGVTAGTGLTGGGTSGTVTLAVAYGTTGTTACVGNDARLSDSRTPTAHAASHATAGGDAITPADIGACADNDARLTDARAPTAHAASHAAGQADEITPESIGAIPDGVIETVDVTIALGAATGSSAADPDLVGATVWAVSPISGNDQSIESVTVGVDGAVTVTTAGNETAEAVFRVLVVLA